MQISATRLFTKSFFCLFLLAQTATAQSFNYVDPATISPEFLTTPFNEDSPELKKQADEIVEIQANLSEAQIKQANDEAWLKPSLILQADNAYSNPEKFPITRKLIQKVDHDCHKVTSSAKDYWNTQRPFNVDERIKPLVGKPGNAAYPSGHTSCSRVVAEVMGQVLPSKRNIFRKRAAEIAYNRIIAGMHWPQDIKGGEQLALIFFGALQQSTDYQNDVGAAIAENNQ